MHAVPQLEWKVEFEILLRARVLSSVFAAKKRIEGKGFVIARVR